MNERSNRKKKEIVNKKTPWKRKRMEKNFQSKKKKTRMRQKKTKTEKNKLSVKTKEWQMK